MYDPNTIILFADESTQGLSDTSPFSDLYILGRDGSFDLLGDTLPVSGLDLLGVDLRDYSAQPIGEVAGRLTVLVNRGFEDQSVLWLSPETGFERQRDVFGGEVAVVGAVEAGGRLVTTAGFSTPFPGASSAEAGELAIIRDDFTIEPVDLDRATPGIQTINPGSGASLPRFFTVIEDVVFFEADTPDGPNLFWIDGDGQVGQLDARPDLVGVQQFDVDLESAIVIEDHLHFAINFQETGRIGTDFELERIEGNFLASNLIVETGGVAYFQDGRDVIGFDDGRPIENPSFDPGDEVFVFDDTIVYRDGAELGFIVDGARVPARLGESVGNEEPQAAQGFVELNGNIYFLAASGSQANFTQEGAEIWVLSPNGTYSQVDADAETSGLQTFRPGPESFFFGNLVPNLVPYEGRLYFEGFSPEEGNELFVFTPDQGAQLVDFDSATPGIQAFTPGFEATRYEGVGARGLDAAFIAIDGVPLVVRARNDDIGLGGALFYIEGTTALRYDLDPTTPEIDGIAADPNDTRAINYGVGLPTGLNFGDAGTGFGQGLSVREAQEVALLYETGLNRDGNIDLPGLNFWIDQRERGLSTEDTAQFFFDSPEFEAAFGDPESLSDRQLVEQLYLNALDRPGEAAGVDFWTSAVADPSFSRAQLLVEFSTSVENMQTLAFVETLSEISPGEWAFV